MPDTTEERLAPNQVTLWACAFSAIRITEEGVQRGSSAHISNALEMQDAANETMEEANKRMPESDGWVSHDVVVVQYTVEVQTGFAPLHSLNTL